MSATKTSDVQFVPKVWQGHVEAYFRRKLVLGQLAMLDNTLESAPGTSVNFPYFKAIGDVQEPAETEGLIVDPLTDDAFSVTVKEVGKAVGWKDAAVRKSAASRQDQMGEAQRQLGRVFAEKVDKDLVSVMSAPGNYADGLIGTASTDVCTVRSILEGKVRAFGDRQDEATAIIMHSLQFMDMMKDNQAGFLQANALDPFYGVNGFIGRLLGMAIFVLDQMPEKSPIGGKRAFEQYILKPNAFGIYKAEEFKMEMDRDILHRENVVAATMWYGTLSLHAKVSPLDLRVCRNVFATSVAA